MRYRLRTLLIVLALGPAVLAGGYWKAEQYYRCQEIKRLVLGMQDYHGDSTFRPIPATSPYRAISWADKPPQN